MNFDNLQNKVEELSRNEQFAARLSACESTAEVAALLSAEGITISEEELIQVFSMTSEATGGELDENALDNVAGGASLIGKLRNVLLPLLPLLPRLPAFPLPVQPIKKFFLK